MVPRRTATAPSATTTDVSSTRTELSRAAIVERAFAVTDEEGPDALTIRRLATEFGVTPMALYWHVRNKDELLAAMGDAFFADIALPDRGGPWDEQLSAIVTALVESLRRHPAMAELAYERILACTNGVELTEYCLRMLVDAGFTEQEAADLARTALHTAVSLTRFLPGAENEVARAEREEHLRGKQAAISALPVERYPMTVGAMKALTECLNDDAYFRFGIDHYVLGARALLARKTA